MDIRTLVKLPVNPNIAAVAPGDTVKVSVKVVEGEKTRSQLFQGVVIRERRGANAASFTVRRVTHGIGVERTFMVHSPLVEKVEVVRHAKVRRARLYYLRELSAREARFKERLKGAEALLVAAPGDVVEPAAAVASEAGAAPEPTSPVVPAAPVAETPASAPPVSEAK